MIPKGVFASMNQIMCNKVLALEAPISLQGTTFDAQQRGACGGKEGFRVKCAKRIVKIMLPSLLLF